MSPYSMIYFVAVSYIMLFMMRIRVCVSSRNGSKFAIKSRLYMSNANSYDSKINFRDVVDDANVLVKSNRLEIEKFKVATLERALLQPDLKQHIDRMYEIGRRKQKSRQHVNPLAASHQQPVKLAADWYKKAFADPSKPLHVDIGCAYGRFCMELAAYEPSYNYLGIEIRWPVVAAALSKAVELNLSNCHFISCNANVDLESILLDATLCGVSVDRVSIQFPDPHFKNRNKKKRVLNPALVETIQKFLSPKGVLFMQGDIDEVLMEMRLTTRNFGTLLKDSEEDINYWLPSNPMTVATEREKYVLAKGGDVYRCLFLKV